MKHFFKKAGVFLFLTLALPLLLVQQTQAAENLFFAQKHAYRVTFRGNGDAFVYARLIVHNSTAQPLHTFSFQLPRVAPEEITGYQQKLPKECIRRGSYDRGLGYELCLEYGEPSYENYFSSYSSAYYGYGDNNQATYKKLTVVKNGPTYSV